MLHSSKKYKAGLVEIYGLTSTTSTSEWVITLWRSCELFLYRDISQVRRTSEISLPKTMNMISTNDHHKLVLVFMLHYY